MSLEIVSVGRSMGGFFKPDEHAQAFAILVEPKRAEMRDGKFGEKLDVTGNMTVFPNDKAASTGQVVELDDVTWNQTYLAKDAEPLIGKAFIAKLAKTESGKGWRWNNISDPAVVQSIVDYVEGRDKAVAAEADEAPEF